MPVFSYCIKTFIRPHLDYVDIIYDQICNDSFHQEMESIQCNVAPGITDAIRGISRENLYQEPCFEPLRNRRWYKKLCYFFKIFNGQSLGYLSECFLALAKHIIQELIITFPSSVVNKFY